MATMYKTVFEQIIRLLGNIGKKDVLSGSCNEPTYQTWGMHWGADYS